MDIDINQDKMTKHAKNTLYDAITITFVMIAALLAAEGRTPDMSRILKFVVVYSVLVVVLKVSHGDVAKQIMTAASIGCGSKLLEIITKP